MKNPKIIIAFSIFYFSLMFSQAQEKPINGNIASVFYRPYLTTTYLDDNYRKFKDIYDLLSQNSNDSAIFNTINLDNNAINGNYTTPPLFDNQFDKGVKKSIKDYLEKTESELNKNLPSFSKNIISEIFNRDKEGNFNFSRVIKDSKFTANDNQFLISKASKNDLSVYSEIADELIKKNYIVTYSISKIMPYEQYSPSSSSNTEGWYFEYYVFISKIDWTEETSKNFFENYWVNENTTLNREQKVKAFDNSTFPTKVIFSKKIVGYSVQSKLVNRKYSERELYTNIPLYMKGSMTYYAQLKMPDFCPFAPIYSTYPNLVKLGTKENIFLGQRFFAYDIKRNKKGELVKKKRGVLRPIKIADNKSNATGTSLTSRFRQTGGKKLHPGNFVVAKPQRFDLFMMYDINNIDNTNIYGSYQLGIAYRTYKSSHLGFSLGFTPINKEKLFKNDSMLSNGIAIPIGLDYFSEIYLTRKGNIYLMPGFGLKLTTNSVWNKDTTITYGNLSLNASLGIGIHLTSFLSLVVKPSVNVNVGSLDFTNGTNILKTSNMEEYWGYNRKRILYPVYVGLRLKF